MIVAVFMCHSARRQERVWRAQRPGAKIEAIATSAGGRDRNWIRLDARQRLGKGSVGVTRSYSHQKGCFSSMPVDSKRWDLMEPTWLMNSGCVRTKIRNDHDQTDTTFRDLGLGGNQ